MPAPIIYINGWPGVGKHTIAKALEKKLDGKGRVVSSTISSLTHLVLSKCQVHNHKHIDLAGAILPRSTPNYYPLRYQLLEVIFSTLATNPETFDHMQVSNFRSSHTS
jgi:hypothetical protein